MRLDQLKTMPKGKHNSKMLQRYEELGFPTQKDEHYRFFTLRSLMKHTINTTSNYEVTESTEKSLIIKNGSHFYLPKIDGIEVSIDSVSNLYKEKFDDPFYHLSSNYAQIVLHIKVTQDASLSIKHLQRGMDTHPYRIEINVDENVSFSIVESFEKGDTKEVMNLYGIDLSLGKYANAEWVQHHSSNAHDAMIATHHITQESETHLGLQGFYFGEGKIMHHFEVDLDKECLFESNHLVAASADASLGNTLYVKHHFEDSTSRLNARYMLKDYSTGIFDAKSIVTDKAKGTKAHQHCKSILLSDDAKMSGKPHLQIDTDELEASHGMSIGALDKDSLFYLQSRGISQSKAKAMLLEGFSNDMIEKVDKEDLRDLLSISIQNYLLKDTL